jgi:UPF0755 protein
VARYDHQNALDHADPNTLLFGHDDDHLDDPSAGGPVGFPFGGSAVPAAPRAARHHAARASQARRRRLVLVVSLIVVVGLILSGWLLVKPVFAGHKAAPDYAGSGTGTVRVRVNAGDGTSDIGTALQKAGVVHSAAAFVQAAASNANAESLQPGLYQLRQHMSAAAALGLMLDPSSRLVVKLTIPEGTTERDVLAKLATVLKVSPDAVKKAAADIGNLALPEGYSQNGAAPTSAEGFLYPATYSFDPETAPSDALQQMTAQFIDEDRQLNFAGTAAQLKVTPYQALIIASMVEGEAKFDADRAKVARVIYNHLAAGTPLKIDATSRYGAVQLGKDPAATPYAELDSPYNTYLHKGLPPTPINNPGSAAMSAAVNPARGNWLFYVNGDAAGHLAFFNNEADFVKAVAVCRQHRWGCA